MQRTVCIAPHREFVSAARHNAGSTRWDVARTVRALPWQPILQHPRAGLRILGQERAATRHRLYPCCVEQRRSGMGQTHDIRRHDVACDRPLRQSPVAESGCHLKVGGRRCRGPDERHPINRPEVFVDPQMAGFRDAEMMAQEAKQVIDRPRLRIRNAGGELRPGRDKIHPAIAHRGPEGMAWASYTLEHSGHGDAIGQWRGGDGMSESMFLCEKTALADDRDLRCDYRMVRKHAVAVHG